MVKTNFVPKEIFFVNQNTNSNANGQQGCWKFEIVFQVQNEIRQKHLKYMYIHPYICIALHCEFFSLTIFRFFWPQENFVWQQPFQVVNSVMFVYYLIDLLWELHQGDEEDLFCLNIILRSVIGNWIISLLSFERTFNWLGTVFPLQGFIIY